jgi:hypothetical protein
MLYHEYSFYSTVGYVNKFQSKNERLEWHLTYIKLQKLCMEKYESGLNDKYTSENNNKLR